MARFNASEADNYGSNSGHDFFSLQNDKDTAKVRFMYNGIEDVGGYAVHEVEIDGRKRKVNCLRSYNDPISKCPFCEDKMTQYAKVYIPIYEEDTGNVKVWERGKKFLSKISSLCAHYPNLVSHVFEIERNGKKGDQKTTYEIYPVSSDNTTLEDLPEVPDVLGSIILDKSADEMNYYLDYGEFPDASNGSGNDAPIGDVSVIRRREEARPSREEYSRRPTRRTPSRPRGDEVF